MTSSNPITNLVNAIKGLISKHEEDKNHAEAGGTPKPIGKNLAAGTNNDYARADHVHTVEFDDVLNTPNALDVVDNLTTNDGSKPLSAKQGKWLNDNKAQLSHNHNDTYYTESEIDTKLATAYTPASATPLNETIAGTVGTSAKYAREDHQHPIYNFTDLKGTDNTEGYIDLIKITINNTYQDKPIVIKTQHRDKIERSIIQIKFANINTSDPALNSITHTGQDMPFHLYKESTSNWILICGKGHNNKYDNVSMKIDNPNHQISITKLGTHRATLPTTNITQSTYIGFTSTEKTKLAGIETGANKTTFGTTSTTACVGNDSRLSDHRIPHFTAIPANKTNNVSADLNTYRTGGFYYVDNDNNSQLVYHTPKSDGTSGPYTNNKSFFLLVETWGDGAGSYVKQTLTYYNTNETFVRTKTGGADTNANWKNWVQLDNNNNTSITSGDLNDYKTPGNWLIWAGDLTNISNAPVSGGLFVRQIPNGFMQIICQYGADTKMWYRNFYAGNSTWTGWVQIYNSGTIPTASTSTAGIVKTTDSTSTTSSTIAASATAVKAAYDKGNHTHPYLPLAGGTITGAVQHSQLRIENTDNIPYAGAFNWNTNWLTTLKERKSLIGTVTDGSKWWGVINIRHRNGSSDGQSWGMYIKSKLTENGNLIWQQDLNGTATNEKTILDSSNYSTYANKTTIANNLTTSTAGSALDATQGKWLYDNKQNKQDSWCGSVDTTHWYLKPISFEIKGAYTDRPITFRLDSRRPNPIYVTIIFRNENSTDPQLATFETTGGDNACYLYKEATSKWSLIVKKSELYDGLATNQLVNNNSNITITYPNQSLETLPTSNIQEARRIIHDIHPNLLDGTRTFTGSNYSNEGITSSLASYTHNGCTVRYFNGGQSQNVGFRWTIPTTQQELGGIYTLSFWARTDSNHSNAIAYFYQGVNVKRLKSNGTLSNSGEGGFGDGGTAFNLTNAWRRYYVTWQMNSSGTLANKTLLIRLTTTSTNAAQNLVVCGVKFEKGPYATEYCESVVDGITDGTINGAAKIAQGSITAGRIADGAVTSAKIADGTIVNTDISAGAAIAASKIADGTAHSNIGSAANATQATINTKIDTALGGKQAIGNYAESDHTHTWTKTTPATGVVLYTNNTLRLAQLSVEKSFNLNSAQGSYSVVSISTTYAPPGVVVYGRYINNANGYLCIDMTGNLKLEKGQTSAQTITLSDTLIWHY